jgi:MerR family transcriptional regulator, thiopeptide resistance regulator
VRHWKIGELAGATGVTVRALHHYEEIGLLVPAERTGSGHRVYDEENVRRLYRVLALRQLGLRLDEVRTLLDDGADLREAVRRHLGDVERRLAAQEDLRRRLAALLELLERGDDPGTDDVIATIERMTMLEKYYTREQLAQLEERRRELGDEAIERAQREWAELIEAVEAERRAGTDPADPRVQALAARWQALIEQFTGGDPGIRRSLQRMYEEEGVETASRGAVSPELMAYAQRAISAGHAS